MTEKSERLRVGLLVSEYYDSFMCEACQGAMRAAEEMDENLYLLTGGYLKANFVDTKKNDYEYQNNVLYEFTKNAGLDVLIVFLGTIAGGVGDEEKLQFLKGFGDIPIITVASEVAGYTSIMFDNRAGFAHGVEYLIREQGRKKICMVSGPKTSPDAIERLEAYREVLAKYELECSEEQIVYGNFSGYCDEVITELVDKNPDLDAICFANDHMARTGYRVLAERGKQVGTDVSIIGFDDSEFAPILNPGLTTTKADPVELGYQAFVHACEMVRKKEHPSVVESYRVPTNLIVRLSCGGRRDDIIVDDIELDPTTTDLTKLVEAVIYKVFDYSSSNSNLNFIREQIRQMLSWMNENVYHHSYEYSAYRELTHRMNLMLDAILERTQQVSNLYDLTEYILDIYHPFVPTTEDQVLLREAKAELFRGIHLSQERARDAYQRANDNLNWVMMDITRDINSQDSLEDKYCNMVRKMKMLDMKCSYVLLFPEIIHHTRGEKWNCPEKVFAKALQQGERVDAIPEDRQSVALRRFFFPDNEDMDRRKTLVLTMLFSGTEQYGIMVFEPKQKSLVFVEPIRFQISSALQTMNLFQDKEKMTKQLQRSMLELKESNVFLDQVSKADELTQIYNRRGLLVTMRNMVRAEENYGKQAFFLYGDMNNLKLINDQFGHEEGDYSLKAVADILKAALGTHAIIGRVGGDEFGIFYLIESRDQKYITEEVIREHIDQETERLNAGNDKPYYVSLTAGIKFFTIEEETDLDAVMAEADANLYHMKRFKRRKILK